METPMKDRILFVDDEPNILQGIQRMLRPMRNEWEMVFVDGGEKALDIMKRAPANVVVSDMRMPGMDGAALFEKLREIQPDAVRIILSGFADQESVFRTIGPAHQYIAKPCDSDTLVKGIGRALKLRNILSEPTLRTLISGMGSLPTPPHQLSELLRELNSEEGSAEHVAAIIMHDVAMTATILKLTNSSFFSLATEVTSPLQAVRLLGFDTIKSVVLVGGLFSQVQPTGEFERKSETLSNRSLFIGSLAKAIAKDANSDKQVAEHAFIAGALSHIGTLLLMSRVSDNFREACELAESKDIDITTAEKTVMKAAHAEIGAYLLGLWGFTNPIVEAVAYHHAPGELPHKGITSLLCVHVAQELARPLDSVDPPALPSKSHLDIDYLRESGVEGKLNGWRKIALDLKEKIELT